ncbi:MAG TPA: sensor histidine kinase [Solirubrobacteraceae bacterium]|nr:sensor histidine kinase [Solirubrobacteraceae bacterium]
MLLASLDRRLATAIRLVGLALVGLSVFGGSHHPGTSGRGLVVSLLFAAAALSWLIWTARPNDEEGSSVELYVMAVAGGLLVEAAPQSAASVFVFVAVIVAGVRMELARAALVVVAGALAVAVSDLLYNGNALGVLAYTLGFAVSLLAASNARQRSLRIEQADLLLAQTQRSHEEQLRAARLEESSRIARDIHDVLAHTLAGLTIQLEATGALLEQGADRDDVLARVHRAHELAREGLQETRRAVGALRGDAVPTPAAVQALVAEYRAGNDAGAELTIDGDPSRLSGATGEAVLRIVQEALTNVRKHAPGAEVSVTVHAGAAPDDQVVLIVDDRPTVAQPAGGHGAGRSQGLAATGGGYGVRGMRERAELLGGTLSAGRVDGGWRVELRLPAPAGRESR